MKQPQTSSRLSGVLVIVALGLAAGCSTMGPGYEAPSVTVSSFRAIPAQGAMPNFEIGLRVLNPNATPLKLRGMSFSISLDGQNLIKGVGNSLPIIEPYGAGDFSVTASANMLGGIRLLGNLMNSPKDSFEYALKAKLDVGAFRPALRIKDSGQISLRQGVEQ